MSDKTIIGRAEATMEKLTGPRHITLRGEELPEVVRASRCALPIVFTLQDCPEYPGTRGTCTALRYGEEVVFVTAAHNLRSCDERTLVEVPTDFRGVPVRSAIRSPMLVPHPVEEKYEGVCDFAVGFPASPPSFVDGHSEPYDLSRVARMEAAPLKAVFAVAGYPAGYGDLNEFDYELRSVTFGLRVAIGTYAGPSTIAGHHVLDVSTAETGGPNGMSGGPVFRLLHDELLDTWTPAFAGIATMGSAQKIQFIDIAFLGTFLRNEVFRSS